MASEKKTDELSGEEKYCPLDKTLLLPVQSEAVPLDVTLLKCVDCRGVFAFPDDLVRFKRAQKAKINFFKLWSKPLPSLKSVLVVSFFAVTTLSLIASFISFSNLKYSTSSAADVIQHLVTLRTGNTVFISFSTTRAAVTHIKVKDKTSKKTFTISISSEPTTLHVLTTTKIDPTHDVYYELIITDNEGHEIRSPEKKLLFK